MASTAAFGAVSLAAVAALSFLMMGGSYHPNILALIVALCCGLCLASLERGWAVYQPNVPDFPATAIHSAMVLALVMAVFWVPFYVYPVSVLLAGLAGAFAWFRYGRWVPVSLLAVAIPHLAIAVWMLFGRFHFESRPDGANPNPYFWPLMATSLAIVSVTAIASAIQMRRRIPELAS